MIVWITGNSGAGKTTMAYQLKTNNTIILDGDVLRGVYPTGFSKEDRWQHNLRTAKLAKRLEYQGFDVIISLICPYKKLRDEVQKICGCGFIYLDVEMKGEDYPYEKETDKFYWIQSVHR